MCRRHQKLIGSNLATWAHQEPDLICGDGFRGVHMRAEYHRIFHTHENAACSRCSAALRMWNTTDHFCLSHR